MRQDKAIVELLLLLLAFLALYVFAPDIIPLLRDAESSDVAKPVQSLFLFFRLVMELFTNLVALVIMYLIGAGIIMLNGRRS